MTMKNALTTPQPFDTVDGIALFSVNAGVPIEAALERAADLMLYVETLATADAFINKAHESGVIQQLSQMASALVRASQLSVRELLGARM